MNETISKDEKYADLIDNQQSLLYLSKPITHEKDTLPIRLITFC